MAQVTRLGKKRGAGGYNCPVKIYTRTGDSGETGLFGGGRVDKDAQRVEAYGTVDELNATLGVALAARPEGGVSGPLERIQTELFELGADLATPPDSSARANTVVRFNEKYVAVLEAEIDLFEAQLEPLTTFIVPGGSPAGAALHLARTVCRRAERRAVSLARDDFVSPPIMPYLNRLSDLLFVLARVANVHAQVPEQKWLPKK